MANKYRVTKLDTFELVTESQVYKTTVEVDSLDYITFKFGESFSLRFDYKQAEKLEENLKTARFIIQDQATVSIDEPLTKNSHEISGRREPNDPANW